MSLLIKQTEFYKFHGFNIIADASGNYKETDSICQFQYKGFTVSASTAGRSAGACQTEVMVFTPEDDYANHDGFNTVEEAIDWINHNSQEFSDKVFEDFVKAELGDAAVKDSGRYISPKISNYKRVWDHCKSLVSNKRDWFKS